MAGKGGLGVIIGIGALAVVAGGKFIYDKYKNFKVELDVAKTKNELNDKIIDSQNKIITELEKKLKKLESK